MTETELIERWQMLLKMYSKEQSRKVLKEGVEIEKKLGCDGDVGKFSYFTRCLFFKESLASLKKGIDNSK